MSNYTGGSLVVCPFYVREDYTTITCEGFAKGTYTQIPFRTTKKKRAFQQRRCEQLEYERLCPLAAALSRKHALANERKKG